MSLRMEVYAQEHSERKREREREREEHPRLRSRRLKVGTMLKRKLENLCFVTLCPSPCPPLFYQSWFRPLSREIFKCLNTRECQSGRSVLLPRNGPWNFSLSKKKIRALSKNLSFVERSEWKIFSINLLIVELNAKVKYFVKTFHAFCCNFTGRRIFLLA